MQCGAGAQQALLTLSFSLPYPDPWTCFLLSLEFCQNVQPMSSCLACPGRAAVEGGWLPAAAQWRPGGLCCQHVY